MDRILTSALACAASIPVALAQDPAAAPPSRLPVSWEAVLEAAPSERPKPWTDDAPAFLAEILPTVPEAALTSVDALASGRDAVLLLAALWRVEHAEDLLERPELVLRATSLVEKVNRRMGLIHLYLLAAAEQNSDLEALTSWLGGAPERLQAWIQAVLKQASGSESRPEWHRLFAMYQARSAWVAADLEGALALAETAHALYPEPGRATAWAIALRALLGDLAGARRLWESAVGSAFAADAHRIGEWFEQLDAEDQRIPRDLLEVERLLRSAKAPNRVIQKTLLAAYDATKDPDVLARLGQLELERGNCLRGRDMLVDAYRGGAKSDAPVITLAVLHRSLPPSQAPSIPAAELTAELAKRSTVSARFAALMVGMAELTAVEFSQAFAANTATFLDLVLDAPHVPALHTVALASAAISTDDVAAAAVFAVPIQPLTESKAPNVPATEALTRQRAVAAVYRCVSRGLDLDERARGFLRDAEPMLGSRAVLLRALAAARLIDMEPDSAPAVFSTLADALMEHQGDDRLLNLWLAYAKIRSPEHDPPTQAEIRELLDGLPRGDPWVCAALVMVSHARGIGTAPPGEKAMLDGVAQATQLTWFLRAGALLLRADALDGAEQEAVWEQARVMLRDLGDPHRHVRFDLRRHSIAWFRTANFGMRPRFGADPAGELGLYLNADFHFEFGPLPPLPGAEILYR